MQCAENVHRDIESATDLARCHQDFLSFLLSRPRLFDVLPIHNAQIVGDRVPFLEDSGKKPDVITGAVIEERDADNGWRADSGSHACVVSDVDQDKQHACMDGGKRHGLHGSRRVLG